jgi:hypothetical protein
MRVVNGDLQVGDGVEVDRFFETFKEGTADGQLQINKPEIHFIS